jgi:hypothetical protein
LRVKLVNLERASPMQITIALGTGLTDLNSPSIKI